MGTTGTYPLIKNLDNGDFIMSIFIASTISFNKEMTTYKLKGGDNNLIPRSNEWTCEMPIEYLYYDLNCGGTQLLNGNEKNRTINKTINEFDHFGGSWDEKTDYFHVSKLPTIEEKESFYEKEISTIKNTYRKECIEESLKVLLEQRKDFYKLKNKIKKFNDRFLTKLFYELKHVNNKKEYILKLENYGFISAIKNKRFFIANSKDEIKKFTYLKAEEIENRYRKVSKVKI